MKKIQGCVAGLLHSILWLCLVGPLAAQQPAVKGERPAGKAGDKEPAKDKDRHKLVTVQGQAKVNAHVYRMEQGHTYRITLKAEGFAPQVRIENQTSGLLANPIGTPYTGPGSLSIQGAGQNVPKVAQMLFTAPATKEYQIKVDQIAGTELGSGPLTYALTIDKASFLRQLEAKDPKLEIAENSKKMEQGKLYAITVTGKGFAPEVQILDGNRAVAAAYHGRWFGFGPDSEFVSSLTFAPTRTADYRILVGVGPVADKRRAPLAYTTDVAELKLDLNVNEQLTKDDAIYPRRGGPFKAHTIKLEAGKNYQIDMISRAFDPYLFLEDSAGNVLMEDDDGGVDRNARLVFRPAKTDSYRIVATTFARTPGIDTTGDYTLMVAQNPNAQPRYGHGPILGSGQGDLPK